MVRVRSRSPTAQQNGIWSMHPMAILAILITIGIIALMTLHIPYTITVTPISPSSSSNGMSSSSRMRGKNDMTSSSTSFSTVQIGQPSQYYESTNDDTCHYYLAESAIPMSGLGLFTTHPIEKGQMSQSMPDICIYVADTPKKDYTHFETHSWSRDTWLGMYEGMNPRAACEGFATLFNTMPPGVQTSKLLMLHPPNNVNLSRKVDLNAGAITQYDGISSVATRDIPAGAEITIDYEDFEYDEDTEYVAPFRSVEWIRQHGMCIDNIRIDTATDPMMGRGAFAKRTMKQGTRIAPAPLQIFPDRSVFIKAQQEYNKKKGKDQPEPLLINYCFTIDDPSNKQGMLLFPYGPGVNLINHSYDNPNVKLEWSFHPMHHNTWLDLPFEQYATMDYPGGLIIDIIALRDIEEGEELFLNYGAAWQDAWEQHVQKWKPHTSSKTYVYPQDMDLTQPFKTLKEQEKSPYAKNLQTVCFTNNWPNRDKTNKLKWIKPKKFSWPEGITYCNILSRTQLEDGKYEYEVSLHYDFNALPNKKDMSYIDTNVPHSAIAFMDLPYTSDMHLPNAFRYPIQLPSHLIPSQWTSPMRTKKQKI